MMSDGQAEPYEKLQEETRSSHDWSRRDSVMNQMRQFLGGHNTNPKQPDDLAQMRTVCLLVIAILCTGFMVVFLKPILVPFILAYVYALMLGPLVHLVSRPPLAWFTRRSSVRPRSDSHASDAPTSHSSHNHAPETPSRAARVCRAIQGLKAPWWFAVTLAIGLSIGIVVIAGAVITAEITEFVANWESSGFQDRASEVLQRVLGWADRLGLQVDNTMADILRGHSTEMQGFVLGLVSRFLSISTDLGMTIIFTIYILMGSSSPEDHSDEVPDTYTKVHTSIRESIGVYVRTKVILSVFTGLLTSTWLSVMGVELAISFGLIAFLFNFIPNVGSLIAVVIPIPVIILDPNLPPLHAVLAIVVPIVIQSFIGNVVEPKMLGKLLDQTEMVVLLSVLLWASLWDIVGLFLAVPLTSVILIGAREIARETGHPFFMTVVRVTCADKQRYHEMISSRSIQSLS